IQDPVYGFSAVNVEAQLASPSSLLTWMRRMIAVRRSHVSFGRGTLRFLHPSNRKVLVYLRESPDERILCVANVSRAAQAVELDLAEFKDAVPIELTAGSLFPAIESRSYLLTLPAYGFFWFRLEAADASKERQVQQPAPGLFTLVATGKLETILAGRELIAFERTVAPRFLTSRRWFAPRETPIADVSVKDFAVLRDGGQSRFVLPLLDVRLAGGEVETYFMPLAAELERENGPSLVDAAARLRRGALTGLLYEAEACEDLAAAMLAALQRGEGLDTCHGGRISFSPTRHLGAEPLVAAADVHRIGAGQRNSSLVLANQMMLKIHHRLQTGEDSEVETLRFLTEVAHFAHSPPLLGVIEHVDRAENHTVLAILQTFMRNQGDAWTWTLEALKRIFEAAALTPGQDDRAGHEEFASYVPHMRRLGLRTAEMHKALATPTADPAFKAEALTFDDVRESADAASILAKRAFARLRTIAANSNGASRGAERLLARRQECFSLIARLVQKPLGAIKIRTHGDYRLGRLLVVKDDAIIVDFGEGPSISPDQRRAKTSPLRDVAVMLRSFAHAVAAAKRDLARLVPGAALAAARLREELVEFSQIFIQAYMDAARDSPIWIEDEGTRIRLLVLYLLAEALHEIENEAEKRVDWIDTSINSVNAILDRMANA
ncbi:MAG: putative maltokinase, partial [Methylocella sp.]